ncbi:alpha/beta fold hydrolase [Amycolatopsis sp. CA-161197]|uniref:alpha/beta fold hydrolase n=1 Tax=Amycolatopsis sp. CA-161197 TaxID=3239922 RepID=UPI003D91C145
MTIPTLVIHGDSGAIVPFEISGKRTAETVKDARLVFVADAPHGLNVTHAATFNAELLTFLRERARRPVGWCGAARPPTGTRSLDRVA